ncbi:protein prenyltransferase alpha subunit repeat-containing protein 1 [Macrosteles quadrilineatus]|uniref:protein prenyltransferase alpha subunit repeat-containing protein 1 n=1 Tax=Macrosteles quadrilineatus TaxID=74068 RepID=UPI0023E10835|nr:protein prenyltransferase alpha subunit repeat-containing protein 1 [Macrosteles quadrilineatus]
MDEHAFPAAERIINDIGLIFKKDPKLKEFQILPVSLNENRSPVHHVNNCLGLESWCVPHVYCYAYNLLMDIRQQKRRREDTEYTNHLLMGALLLNPEVSVMWNMRREMSGLEPQSELHFTSVVLTRKPKSAEVFDYRKWLIKKLMKVYPCDPALVASEVHACQLAAELYPNNYYAWNHRIWCLNLLPYDSGSYVSFLVSEWMLTHKWVSSHISDHSGFQYRQHLLQKFVNLPPDGYNTVGKCTTDIEQSATCSLQMFLTSTENKKSNFLTEMTRTILTESSGSKCENMQSIPLGLILSELLLNTDLIVVYPGHEAIWYHRRFLIHLLRECISNLRLEAEHKDRNGVSPEKTKRVESIGEGLLERVVRFETALYSKCRTDKDRQASYAEKHRAWLASIMKINLHLPLR